MITPPTTPSPGKPVSAGFFARLIRWIKSGQLVEGPGYRLKRGPNGTVIEILGKAITRKTDVSGRFAIVSISPAEEPGNDGENLYAVTLKNPYYDVGGRTYEMQRQSAGEAGGDESQEEGQEEGHIVSVGMVRDGSIIVLKVSAKEERTESLTTVGSLSELQELQGDVAYYTFPLYKLQGGSVVCDFRTGPTTSMGEFSS